MGVTDDVIEDDKQQQILLVGLQSDGTPTKLLCDSNGKLQITVAASGDITSVVAGSGLTGGATTGDATINIGAGTGIDVATDAISVDVSDFLTNGVDNRVVTATGTDAMNSEANLTFDGSTLEVIGAAKLRQGGVTSQGSATTLSAATHAGNYIIATGDNHTINLPSTSTIGEQYCFIATHSNGCTIGRNGNNINGATSDITVAQYKAKTAIAIGSNDWVVIG